jgi:UDP:flavonoid glycosyltransferase YjiC (YdhE family)
VSSRRILIACELGEGEGPSGRLLPLANALRGRGHSVRLAVRQPDRFRPHDVRLAPAWQAPPPPGFLASCFPDILWHAGYATVEALFDLVTAWRDLLAASEPDLLIADFAPTAMLAARTAGVPVAACGDGYALPPLTDPMPCMRPWATVTPRQLTDSADRVLPVVNAILSRFGRPALAVVADLLAAPAQFLCTVPELDHYTDRGEATWCGPLLGGGEGAPPDWPAGSAERVFVQIDGRRPMLAALIDVLDRLGLPAIVQTDHMSARRTQELSRGTVRVTVQPVDRAAVLAGCDVVACQDTALIAPALLSGRPILALPVHVEQMMLLHRVATQGLGHGIPADGDATAVDAALRRLLDDAACRQRAAAFARYYTGYDAAMALEPILEGCEELLENGTAAS